MSYELPEIIFTVKLEPYLNILEDNKEKEREINDLNPALQDIIKDRINKDYLQIISQTISFQYKISSYKYNPKKNSIRIVFVLMPDDIKKMWIPQGHNIKLPEDRSELLTTIRDDVGDRLNKLYGDLAKDTWKKGNLIYYADGATKYLINLRLKSSESFLDWSNVGQNRNINNKKLGGYYRKYMIYKYKYLALKNKQN